MSVYVLVTRAGSEQVVVEDLADAGLMAWTPSVKRWTRIAGCRRRREHALLPRYVFAMTDDLVRDFAALRHARRVSAILGIDGQAKPIEAWWVLGLYLSHALGAFDWTSDSKPKMTINQAVRIVGGAFQGYVGKLVCLNEGEAKVYVEGRFLQGKVSVGIDQLEAA